MVHGAAEMSPVLEAEGEVEFEIVGVLIKSVQRFKFGPVRLAGKHVGVFRDVLVPGVILPILPISVLCGGTRPQIFNISTLRQNN